MLTITHLSGFGRGKSKTYSGPNVILGTDPSCDVRFDPTWDKEVSPRHAQITIQNGECWIDDLGSSTGVWISGKKIVREELNGSVEISLGQNGQRLKIDVPVMAKQASVPVAAHQAHAHVSNSKSSSKAVPIALGLVALLAVAFITIKQRVNIGGNDVTITLGSGDKKSETKSAPTDTATTNAPVTATPSTAPQVTGQMLDSDEKLRLVAKKYEQAVGVVVKAIDGTGNPSGTAWAVAPYTFATNSHITEKVEPFIASGGAVFVVLNKHPEMRFRVKKAITHPNYYSLAKMAAGEKSRLNLDGKAESIGAFDVGLLVVEEDPPVKMPLANKDKIVALDSGHRVAFLGFPMENLFDKNIDMHYPVATMQSGIITSVTDSWMAKASPASSILIHHNLPSAGGASGSPVFDVDGVVIGLHCAGNYTMGFDWDTAAEIKAEAREKAAQLKKQALELLKNPKLNDSQINQIVSAYERELKLITGIPAEALTRITSASLINFAQRVDLLKELMTSNGIPFTEGAQ